MNKVPAFELGSKTNSGTVLAFFSFSSAHLAGAQLNLFLNFWTLFIFTGSNVMWITVVSIYISGAGGTKYELFLVV